MGAPGSGGGDVSVSIAGNASSLQAAINQTTAALNTLSAAINQTTAPANNATAAAQNQAAAYNAVSAAANQAAAAQNQQVAANTNAAAATNSQSSAIQQQIAAYNQATAAINYVNNATAVLGSAQAQANIGWAQAATSADDYASRLALLQAQLNYVNAAQGNVNDGASAGFTQMMNLGKGVDFLNGNVFASVLQFGDFDAVLGGAAGPIGLVIGLAMSAGSAFTDLTGNVLDLAQSLAGDLVSAAQDAAAELENLLQETFQVTQATEKNYYNWAFIWGGVNQQTGMGPGAPIATQLLEWSKQASLNMPFTRQDLLQAITTLSVMGGQSPGTVETDLQLLSDIASTQGRPGLTLSWAAMAALRGGEGYSRMLLMDLNISKNELAKFGYDEKNPASFFPALQQYEQARGEYGASAYVSQNTMWGASTSLTDRIQNFMLALGGWNDSPLTLTDDVLKGSMFGQLKQGLFDLNSAIDDLNRNGDLPHLADLLSNTLGGALSTARVGLTAFTDGLGQAGLGNFLFGSTTSYFDQAGYNAWLKNNPNASASDKTKERSQFQYNGYGTWGADYDMAKIMAYVAQNGALPSDLSQYTSYSFAAEHTSYDWKALAAYIQANNGAMPTDLAPYTNRQEYNGGGLLQQLSQFANSGQVQSFLHDVGTVVAGVIAPGMKDAALGAEAFVNALGGSGVATYGLQTLADVGKWLASPSTQAGIQQLAGMFGALAGTGAKEVLQTAESFLQGLTGNNAGGGFASGLEGVLGWLEDPEHQHDIAVVAYAVGEGLGGAFQLVYAYAKAALDTIGSLIELGGDLAKFMSDLGARNFAAAAQDAKKLGQDWMAAFQQGMTDAANVGGATNQWLQILNNVFNVANTPQYGVTITPGGGNSPPIGSKAWQEHMIRALTLGDNGSGSAGPQGDTLALSAVASTGGQQFAQTYLASAQNEFAKASNGSQLVSALVTGLQQQIQNGGDALGATLFAVIDTHTRQVIAQSLRNYNLLSNTDLRQPGGYGIGTSLGYK